MSRHKQSVDGKGSLYNIQRLVNHYPEIFIKHLTKAGLDCGIEWVSPLKEDDMAEYRDQDFLARLRIADRITHQLDQFWPNKGPQWDALGIANGNRPILVEAKANIPEIVTDPTGAEYSSLQMIKSAMDQIRGYLQVSSKADWTQVFYQYTNRICHLYYLDQLNRIPAYLVNVYFVGDKSVSGPNTEEEWRGAITVVKEYLGINKRHKLSKQMIDIFVHVNEIGCHAKTNTELVP